MTVQVSSLILDLNPTRNVHCPQLARANRGEQWLQAIFTEQEKAKN